MKRINYTIYVAAVMLLTACTQDVTESGGMASDSRVVTFTAQTVTSQDETRSASLPDALPLTGDGIELWLMPSEEDMVNDATRGTQINSVDALSNFGVSAYIHGAIPSEKTLNEYLTDNNLTPDFFYNLEATKIPDTQKFKLTKDFYWPTDNDVLSFFAYAPYGDENVELSAATEEGPQSVLFKVNTNVKEQADFVTAQAVSTSHLNTSLTPSVALNFTHQLTGVRFVIGDQFLKGWIKSISLKGVYTQGKYTIGGDWTLDETKKGNFTISYNLDKPVAGTPGEEVSASDEVFMMIPHTFAADDAATIEVVYNDKYTDYVVSCPLKGQTWKAGKTVTYAITSNKLTTLQIAQISMPSTPSAASGMPDRAKVWQAGDKIGMYVVSSDGKKLKHKNIPVTYDGLKWNIDHSTSEGTIYKLAGESFYFYYPYSTVSNNQPLGYPEQCPELKADAATFFEGVINYFNVKNDQSTLDNFLASNLMVAKAEDEGHASTIKATMERQVGIAVIGLATKTIPETITYLNNAQQSTSGSYTITASDNFSTNIPKVNGNKYYFFTKYGSTTSFNSKAGEKYYWTSALEYNLEKNGALERTAQTTVEWDWTFKTTATYNYSVQGSCATFTAPITGTYSMNIYGARGAGANRTYQKNSSAGWGGRAYGSISLTAGNKLYVTVGGAPDGALGGNSTTPGYNGGGSGVPVGGGNYNGNGGGGATHIATAYRGTGLLSNYSSYRGEVLLVAGGGGGADDGDVFSSTTSVAYSKGNDGSGGDGGGTTGTNGKDEGDVTSGANHYAEAGTQTTGYAFGQGGPNNTLKVAGSNGKPGCDGGAGGGGWFGGYGAGGYSTAMGGGGGSGYTNTSKLISGTYGMQTGVRGADGYAVITVTRQ